jgi:glutamate N-acetyltransferase / amino-acid N-acetyltransferase
MSTTPNAPVGSAVPPQVEEAPRIPLGFAAGALAAGIKPSGRSDLAIVAVSGPSAASAAGVFTRNLVAAAPVLLSRSHLAESGGRARAVIVTAGCANAATGNPGMVDQAAITDHLSASLGITPVEALCASTGLIGTRLPVDRVRAGIDRLIADGLRAEDASLGAAAEAMMTTDRRRKAASTTVRLPGADGVTVDARITGIVKGVGMIHPDMATMIAIVLTDATVAPGVLADSLVEAARVSFNLLTVDGDTSTNDTALVLASGAAGALPVEPGTDAHAAFSAGLTAVCRSLARQQAADGEGATKLITCRVDGARDEADARAVARTVVGSALVKAAVYGRDPNWGRVAGAAGRALRPDGTPVALDPDRLAIRVCGTRVFAGMPLAFDAPAVSTAMAADEVVIALDLGQGAATAEAWGCDLTEGYVRENAEYST